MTDLPQLVKPGDVLLFNDSKVVPARLHGRKASGGRVEVLVESWSEEGDARAFVRASKTPPAGVRLIFDGGFEAVVNGRDGTLFNLTFNAPVLEVMTACGEVPLPPYIDRPPDAGDDERYQTVYARPPGSVAAPTAGLHFDESLLGRLEERGVAFEYVTLHVGAGTFEPMRVEDLTEHRMHSEYAQLSESVAERIARTRREGGRVICVGTTSLRVLESAAAGGEVVPYAGHTDLFIYPGYRFRATDALLTNFHLPESTLLMLVCAFAGTDNVLAAYRHAVAAGYRFFSYGDAMFVLPGEAR